MRTSRVCAETVTYRGVCDLSKKIGKKLKKPVLKLESIKKKLETLLTLQVESERITLLSHPLVTSLLRTKWQRYGRWLYWLNLSTFFAFLTFLTLYAILLPPPNTGQCKSYGIACNCVFEFLLSHQVMEMLRHVMVP